MIKKNYSSVIRIVHGGSSLNGCFQFFLSFLYWLKLVLARPRRVECNVHHLTIESLVGSARPTSLIGNSLIYYFN